MNTLLNMTAGELRDYVEQLGEPKYRARQIREWLMAGVPFEEMSNLPEKLRLKLREEASEGYPEIVDILKGTDGAVKYLLKLQDGNAVETVLLPQEYGNTLCISTQVGCAMGCTFCASCRQGLVRNLTAGEMLAQVVLVNKDSGEGKKVGRLVLMGMGEPLHNYDEVMRFLREANSSSGLGIGQRNITLSTCGLVDQIDRLADENFQLTLAVSLHSAFQERRQAIMPSAKKYKLPEIIAAADRYFKKTGRRVTFEYTLIDGVNDSDEDLRELVRLLRPLHAHVNIIPLNSASGEGTPSSRSAHAFADKVSRAGVPATVRKSLGADIAGACGQLRQRHMEDSAENATAG